MSKYYLGLVHYPVYNKFNEVVTTSITNLDVHDIARSCLTYGIEKFFIVTPNEGQRQILQTITEFWHTDIARNYNSDRVEAIDIVDYSPSVQSLKEQIKNQEGIYPIIVTTTARQMPGQISFKDLIHIDLNGKPVLLLFGTGNGLAGEVYSLSDHILTPITGKGAYNHLSVRSAVAIVLDRLASEE
jgi:hypothetical protein